MFLKNERGLGVKNGTLGLVEQVTPERMAVRLDDGRNVAFDLKAYAPIDHGYAATFHKAQGVTVDRAHVLTTPGMHRYLACVGLSRHRDGVQLHHGQDDFADRDGLVRALSRERSKDMVSDYTRDFADRRGIARDAFERNAHAVSAIFKATFKSWDGAPELLAYRDELTKARRTLDAFGPDYSRDVECAYKADHSLAHEAAAGRASARSRRCALKPNCASTHQRAPNALQINGRSSIGSGSTPIGRRHARDPPGPRQHGREGEGPRCDPQLESVLAARKRYLGIGFAISGDISATSQLAWASTWAGDAGSGFEGEPCFEYRQATRAARVISYALKRICFANN